MKEECVLQVLLVERRERNNHERRNILWKQNKHACNTEEMHIIGDSVEGELITNLQINMSAEFSMTQYLLRNIEVEIICFY